MTQRTSSHESTPLTLCLPETTRSVSNRKVIPFFIIQAIRAFLMNHETNSNLAPGHRQSGTNSLQRLASILALVMMSTLSFVVGVEAQEIVVTDEQFQINSYIHGVQVLPQVCRGTSENMTVVWGSQGSFGTDTSGSSVNAQIIGPTGTPVGPEFQINDFTPGSQTMPTVSTAPNGSTVVVWESQGSPSDDQDDTSIQAKVIDSSGRNLTAQFQVNTQTYGRQYQPDVSMDPNQMIVTWAENLGGGELFGALSIQGQILAHDGTPIGPQFQVNEDPFGYHLNPSVCAGPGGGFVIAWQNNYSLEDDDNGLSVQAQRFGGDGSRLGDQFQVNQHTPGDQSNPAIALHMDRSFAIAWESVGSSGSDNDGYSIQVRLFNADGTPKTDEIQVNAYTENHQTAPSVSFDGRGNFVVAWTSIGSDGDDNDQNSIQARVFRHDGTPMSDQQQINSFGEADQLLPAVGYKGNGEFGIIWQSQGSHGDDQSGWSIQGRTIYTGIFRDGFESGNTNRWSSSSL